MPPISKLSLNFISSLLTSKRKPTDMFETYRQDKKDIDTLVVSDDENDVSVQDEKQSLRRKAIDESEKRLKDSIAKKKDSDINVNNEMKNLNLNVFDNFSITKN